jgi:hypothetical protein
MLAGGTGGTGVGVSSLLDDAGGGVHGRSGITGPSGRAIPAPPVAGGVVVTPLRPVGRVCIPLPGGVPVTVEAGATVEPGATVDPGVTVEPLSCRPTAVSGRAPVSLREENVGGWLYGDGLGFGF